MSNSPAPTPEDAVHTHPPTRLGMAYDILMLLIIVVNLGMLGLDALLMGGVGSGLAQAFSQQALLIDYRTQGHHDVDFIDDWFTVFLVLELGLRWLWAMLQSHYYRWFFFPFVHWYEVLGCMPAFRALRLLRAVALGYRLHQLGYTILPPSWLRLARFYYDVVLEEVSDRIIINVIDGIERELRQSTTHGELIRQMVDRHRPQIIAATGELLQHSLAPALAERRDLLRHEVGAAVHRALVDVPELHQLLRLMPMIGQRIEQQVQAIGRRIGDNLTDELIAPFSAKPEQDQTVNPAIAAIAAHIGDIPLQMPATEALIESLVFESLEAVRKQVAVQQWKLQQSTDTTSDPQPE
jgi:hypothetical protein